MRCPKSRFPIRIIVFDKLELIIFESQGLTLSTCLVLVSSCRGAHFLYLLDSISFAEVDVRVCDAVRKLEPCPHQSSTHSLHDIRSAIMEISVFIFLRPP